MRLESEPASAVSGLCALEHVTLFLTSPFPHFYYGMIIVIISKGCVKDETKVHIKHQACGRYSINVISKCLELKVMGRLEHL